MSTGTLLRSRPGIYVLVVPLLAGLCALGATLALSEALTSREESQLRLRTDAEARHFAAQVRGAVLTSLDVFPRIGEWWLTQGRPAADDDWNTDAQLFLRADLGLRQVSWLSPAGLPLWCARPGSKPDFHCSSIQPGVTALARQSIARTSTLLSDVAIRENVPQFVALAPIVRHKRAVGVVAATFDASALIRSLLREQIPAGYAMRVAANGVSILSLPYTGGPLWKPGIRAATVKVGNRWWSVELIPAMSDLRRLQRVVWSFGVLVSVLVYVCSALALIYKRNESTLRFAIAERRRAEQQVANLNRDLQNQVDDFKTLLDALPVGIAVSDDPECHHIWVNPRLAAMLGTDLGQNISFSGPDAGSLPYKMFRGDAEVPPDELPMQLAARTGKSVLDVEFDIIRADGSVLNTLSYAVPVFDREGNLRRIINSCVDVTERKRSERERRELEDHLQRAEKDRSLAVMAAGVAHDFNNLLTAILGYSELAHRELPPGRPANAIQQVIGASRQAAELVDQLLAYTGQSWLELRPLDLSDELRSMEAHLRSMVPPQIEFDLELAPVLPPVHAGSRQVRQVVTNLVSNAVEAIGQHSGEIRVRTGWCTLAEDDLARDYPNQKLSPGPYVRLEVADTGCGAPREVAERVFDPFFTTKFLGRGLGLSAVHGIMMAHRGGVRFDSTGPDGAHVHAIFPVATAEGIRGRVA